MGRFTLSHAHRGLALPEDLRDFLSDLDRKRAALPGMAPNRPFEGVAQDAMRSYVQWISKRAVHKIADMKPKDAWILGAEQPWCLPLGPVSRTWTVRIAPVSLSVVMTAARARGKKARTWTACPFWGDFVGVRDDSRYALDGLAPRRVEIRGGGPVDVAVSEHAIAIETHGRKPFVALCGYDAGDRLVQLVIPSIMSRDIQSSTAGGRFGSI